MNDLFGFDATAAKREAMERAAQNANPQWRVFMLGCVIRVAKRERCFTTDDVLGEADKTSGHPETHDKRALGPVMLEAAKMGICRKSDRPWVPTSRRSRHAAPLQVWDSLTFSGSK